MQRGQNIGFGTKGGGLSFCIAGLKVAGIKDIKKENTDRFAFVRVCLRAFGGGMKNIQAPMTEHQRYSNNQDSNRVIHHFGGEMWNRSVSSGFARLAKASNMGNRAASRKVKDPMPNHPLQSRYFPLILSPDLRKLWRRL
jgi:hypothetical protein